MKIKNQNQIKNMKIAGKIIAKIHLEAKKFAKPGANLIEVDELASKIIKENNGKPLFLNYQGYPAHICTSLNSEVIHGIPRNYILKDGDFFTLDVGVEYNGMAADAATAIEVGKLSPKDKRLINATKATLQAAIDIVKPGTTLGDIGHTIETTAKKYNYNISEEYVGHFIGEQMHEEPLVLNTGIAGKGLKLKEGMTFCIEPILIDGDNTLFVDPLDKWTVRTRKGSNASHEEHTILVTKNGAEILTK